MCSEQLDYSIFIGKSVYVEEAHLMYMIIVTSSIIVRLLLNDNCCLGYYLFHFHLIVLLPIPHPKKHTKLELQGTRGSNFTIYLLRKEAPRIYSRAGYIGA